MSKIVCDVCGSSYSETEAYCPICGTKKSEEAKPVVETTAEERPVKAGKYSQTPTNRSGSGTSRRTGNGNSNNNRGKQENNTAMIIIVAVLMLAIVAVCVFIAVRMLGDPSGNVESTGGDSVLSTSADPNTDTIECTGIELEVPANKNLEFADKTQAAIQLTVKPIPENTTEKVVCTYTSSDPQVVLVDAYGNVTPVGKGTATITIAYKDYAITVNVTCTFANPNAKLALLYNDITLNASKPTENLYNGQLDVTEIRWTSSDEAVATVSNGVVTGLKDGKVTITATYGTQTATCIVRVSGLDKEQKAEYALWGGWSFGNDFTLPLNETMTLSLCNKSTKAVVSGLEWHVSDDFSKHCQKVVKEDGSVKITATASTSSLSPKYVKIWTIYEGVKYECMIRVPSKSAS